MEETPKTNNTVEIEKINQELERTRAELVILYEISNAMRTTLRLEEILYIILTGVTAHAGLGFNRAMLFLVNEKDGLIEGKMAIGPETDAEANKIWTQIEEDKLGLDDLINAYKISNTVVESGFNKQVQNLRIALSEIDEKLLTLAALDGMPLHLNKDAIQAYADDPIIQILKTEELVLVPLKAKDKVNGIILADNFVTKKPITKDDLHMLIMLANQAGLAIENSQLYEKTVTLAHTDYLTGLWNHGYFQYILHEEIGKAKNNKTPLSLLMLDIDDFKIYNDSFGHQAGDKILKDVAFLIKQQSRKIDYACRYGGEEFTLILPCANKKEALAIAERIRENIKKFPFIHEEILPSKKLTASLGLATFGEDGVTAAELIAASDKKLYQAKNKGKNFTCY